MLEGGPTQARSGHAAAGYSYPGDLARFVRDRWDDAPGDPDGADPLPEAAELEGFLVACYQASMLRAEDDRALFLAILAEPALFDPAERPPEGLQRLEFLRPLPFDPRKLRRLSVAADRPFPPIPTARHRGQPRPVVVLHRGGEYGEGRHLDLLEGRVLEPPPTTLPQHGRQRPPLPRSPRLRERLPHVAPACLLETRELSWGK